MVLYGSRPVQSSSASKADSLTRMILIQLRRRPRVPPIPRFLRWFDITSVPLVLLAIPASSRRVPLLSIVVHRPPMVSACIIIPSAIIHRRRIALSPIMLLVSAIPVLSRPALTEMRRLTSLAQLLYLLGVRTLSLAVHAAPSIPDVISHHGGWAGETRRVDRVWVVSLGLEDRHGERLGVLRVD
jgi:hypothetical protein